MPGNDTADLRNEFRHFGEMCQEASPLYAHLSPRVADDPELLALAAHAEERQPAVNLLFAAVQFLLLGGVEHELRQFYRSIGGRRDAAEAWPVFVDFCRAHRDTIVELIGNRRVQTNQVGRCGLLVPPFALVQARFARPLHLIEVGASAGLNLLFDRYRYEYSDGRACGPESPVVIRTELHGDHAPTKLPERHVDVAGRIGIDLSPVDVTDDDAVRWIEALIWPDELDRHALHRHAVSIARRDPPRILAGDGLDLLPEVMRDVTADALPCVYHSHAIYQMPEEWRRDFEELLDGIGRERDLAHVSLEWLGDDPGPQLHLTCWSHGRARTRHLADCHHHGRWVRWLDKGPSAS